MKDRRLYPKSTTISKFHDFLLFLLFEAVIIKNMTKKYLADGFLRALGVSLYCFAVGLFIWKASNFFGSSPQFFGPIVFLLLFIVSALICAAIVFYTPYVLFTKNKKQDAIDLVIVTTFLLFFILCVILLLVLLF